MKICNELAQKANEGRKLRVGRLRRARACCAGERWVGYGLLGRGDRNILEVGVG